MRKALRVLCVAAAVVAASVLLDAADEGPLAASPELE